MQVRAVPAGAEGRAAEAARAVLVRLAWAGTAVTAVSLPLSIAGLQIGVGVALGALLLLAASGRRVWVPSPLTAPVLILTGAAAASVVVAALAARRPPRVDDLLYVRGLAVPLVVLLAIEAGDPGEDPAAPRRRALGLVLAWGLASLVPAGIAWAQHRSGFDLLFALGLRDRPVRAPIYTQLVGVATGRYAAVGLFSWYTRLAQALTPLIALSLSLAVFAPLPRRRRVLLAVIAAAGTWAVVLTTSRSAWAGLALAAAVVGAAAGRVRRRALPLAAVAALAVGCAMPVLRGRLEHALAFDTNADRAAIWTVCAEVIRDHPVAGVGFGALPRAGRPYFARMPPEYPVHAWCHDSVLSAWAEGGPLLAGALLLWAALLGRAFLRWRRGGDPLGRAAAVGALAALCALGVNALVHDLLWVTEPLYAMGFLVGVAAVLARPRPGGAPPGGALAGGGWHHTG